MLVGKMLCDIASSSAIVTTTIAAEAIPKYGTSQDDGRVSGVSKSTCP
jgi:hypothetical protein